MEKSYRKFLIILTVSLLSCTNQPTNEIIGKWQILSVIENEHAAALNDNWISIKSDGTFNSHDGESNKEETGVWNYYPNEQRLYIDSDAGEEDDSEWILNFKNDSLIFKGTKKFASQKVYLNAVRLE